jgi:hypothetical protein
MYEHYGFQPLPQHQGNYFFKDQIAHLEIAVLEGPKPSEYVPTMKDFNKTVVGRVLAYMELHPEFSSYRTIGEGLDIPHKSACKAISQLRRMDYKFETVTKNSVLLIKLK